MREESHNVPARRPDNRATSSGSRQCKPAFVSCPGDRPALSEAVRNSGQSLTPPDGLANDPRPASVAGVPKLRENAPENHAKRERKGAPHQSAPVLVARMTMMNA